jgi:hypothetical protein
MLRLAALSALAATLMVLVPSAQSALAQSCHPRSLIIAARSSIPVGSSLPECDGRGRPLPEGPVANYVSPLDPDYGEMIFHGGSPAMVAPAAPSGATSAPTAQQGSPAQSPNGG